MATAGGWLTRYRPREVRNSIYRYRKIHIDYRSKFLYRFISPISIIYGNTSNNWYWYHKGGSVPNITAMFKLGAMMHWHLVQCLGKSKIQGPCLTICTAISHCGKSFSNDSTSGKKAALPLAKIHATASSCSPGGGAHLVTGWPLFKSTAVFLADQVNNFQAGCWWNKIAKSVQGPFLAVQYRAISFLV